MQFSNGIGHFLFEMKINARKEQTILSYCSDQELLQLVKILLQLLIEPSYHRKTRYIKRNNRSIAFVESRFLFDRHSALNFLYIGGSFINNCDRLNKQKKKKKKQSLQIRFH